MIHHIVKKIAENKNLLQDDVLCDIALKSWNDFIILFESLYVSERSNFLYGLKNKVGILNNTVGILKTEKRKTAWAKEKVGWITLYQELACVSLSVMAQLEYNVILAMSPKYERPSFQELEYQIECRKKIHEQLNKQKEEIWKWHT